MENRKNKKFYYGWVVFALCFLMIFVVLGFLARTTYLKAICDDLGFERSALSIYNTVQYLVSAVMSFFFGAVVYRLGARKMVGMGFVSLVCAFMLYFLSTEIWQFYVIGVFLGIGHSLTGTAIVAYLIDRWFPEKKGTLTGIALAANGFGNMVSELVITSIVYNSDKLKHTNSFFRFLTELLGVDGWRLAALLTAMLFTLCGVIMAVFLRNEPRDSDLKEKGAELFAKKKAERSISIAPMLKKPYFYVSGACVFLVGFILQSSYDISKAHMLDVGLSAEYVGVVFGFGALLLALAKMLNGFLFDRMGIRFTYSLCCIAGVISLAVLAFANSAVPELSWGYGFTYPVSMPLETVMIPLLVTELFPRRYYAKILGYYLSLNMLGYAMGTPFVNIFYDLFGTYKGILIAYAIALAAVMVLSLISMQLARRDRAMTESTEQTI